jgi:hypothetical protein
MKVQSRISGVVESRIVSTETIVEGGQFRGRLSGVAKGLQSRDQSYAIMLVQLRSSHVRMRAPSDGISGELIKIDDYNKL